MLEKEIARLYGTLKFKVDYRPLITFEKRLSTVGEKLQAFSALANKRIMMKIGLDSRGLSAKLKAAENAKVTFRNFEFSHIALKTVQDRMALFLGNTKITLMHVKIPTALIAQQKAMLRSMLEATTLHIPVTVNMTKATKALREWKKSTEAKFTVHLNADISRHKLYRNFKNSLDYVTGKIGTIRLTTPMITLKVDRVALRAEIQAVLQQIQREARIRIDLRGHLNGGGGPGGAGGAGGRGGMRGAAAAGGIAGMAGSVGQGLIPGLGGAFVVSHINKLSQEIQGQKMAMTAVTGSEEEGNAARERLKAMADDIGFDYNSVAGSFTKMIASGKGAGMDQSEVEKIFQSMTEYGSVMGLNPDEMKGSLRAIEQMMNKEQIMSEELKQQLGERFPAAMSMMAEAVSRKEGKEISVKELMKMMEGGEVSSDVLKEFAEVAAEKARVGGALDKSKENTRAQQNRLSNAWTGTVEQLSLSGFDNTMATFFKEAAIQLERSLPLIKGVGVAFDYMMKPVRALMRLFGDLGEALPKLAESFGVSEGQLTSFGLAVIGNLFPIGRIISLLGLAVLALEDFTTYLAGGESKFGDWFNSLSPERQERLKTFATAVTNLAEALGKVGEVVIIGWEKIFGWFMEGGGSDFVLEEMTNFMNVLTSMANVIDRLGKGGNVRPAISDLMDSTGDLFSHNMIAELTGEKRPERQYRGQATEAGAAQAAADAKDQGTKTFRVGGDGNLRTAQQGPVKIDKVEFNITGNDPETIAQAVDRQLKKLMTPTKTNLVEVQ